MTDKRKHLDMSKPFQARGAIPEFVLAMPDGKLIFNLKPKSGEGRVKSVILDTMGCDFNTGRRMVWNAVEVAPRFAVGDTLYAVRLGRKVQRPILKGVVKSIEKKSFLVEVPNVTNSSRDDGLFTVHGSSAYSSLEEVQERVNTVIEALNRMQDAERSGLKLRKRTAAELHA